MSEKRIKILQVIHSLHLGGAERVVVDLVEHLDPDRFEVEVCCIKQEGILADRLSEKGYKVHLLPQRSSNLYVNNYRGLKECIQRVKPDIVHSHGDISLVNIGVVYLLNRLPPLVHTFHFGNYPHIKKRYLYAQMLFLRLASKLISVSDFQQRTILRYLKADKRKTSTIYNGVHSYDKPDERKIQDLKDEFSINDKDIVVGCIAVLTEQKGIVYLLDAVKHVVNKKPDIKFLIIGGGPLENNLREYAKKIGVNRNVIFTGWRGDAKDFFPIMDIFVSSSLWEAFSIVVLEAMSAGKALLLTDVGDHKNLIRPGYNGYIVASRSAEGIAGKLLDMLGRKSGLDKMGENAFKTYSDNFTVEKMVIQYEEVFSSIANT